MKQRIVQEESPQGKSKEEQLMELFENISPRQLLEDLADGNQASAQDLKVVSEVMTSQGLNAGVMNVLLHYVLKKTDMKLSKNYLETIASHWARKNVKTVRQAMTLANLSIRNINNGRTNLRQPNGVLHRIRRISYLIGIKIIINQQEKVFLMKRIERNKHQTQMNY